MIVYAEYVFLENFFMNFLILSLTGKFAKSVPNTLKLVVSSAFGALYAFIIFFPSLHFLFSILMKFAFSALIIIICFTPYRFKEFFRFLGIFYLITLIFGGAGFALFYFTSFNGIISNGIFYMSNISIKNFFISGGLAYLLIQFCWGYVQRQLTKEKILIEIIIQLNGEAVQLVGMIDTGNSLKDPISHYPVIIVEYEAIKSLFPKEIGDAFSNDQVFSLTKVINELSGSSWITRFRIIPYAALGTENGMLVGFRPDNVVVHGNDSIRETKEIIIGIYNKKLSNSGDYKALLHPDII